MEYQLITAFRTGGSSQAGLHLQHRASGETERNPIWFQVGGDFTHAQVCIEKQSIQTDPHAEGVDGFARVKPESGVGIEFLDVEQTAAALGAIGSGNNPRGEDTLACQILNHKSGLRGDSHDELWPA